MRIFISSHIIKFITIILTFTISLLLGEYALDGKSMLLLQLGLFITIFADVFLLLLNKNYILGVGLFCIVQISYSIRYDFCKAKLTIKNFIVIFSILFIIYLITEVDFLILIVLYYIMCLLTSTIRGVKLCVKKKYPSPNRQIIALGMILFLLCDINVGLYNIMKYMGSTGKYINISDGSFYNVISISIWLFYLPSQILLCISEYKFE